MHVLTAAVYELYGLCRNGSETEQCALLIMPISRPDMVYLRRGSDPVMTVPKDAPSKSTFHLFRALYAVSL